MRTKRAWFLVGAWLKEAASLQPAVIVVTVTPLGSAFGVLGSTLAVPAARVAAIVMQEL